MPKSKPEIVARRIGRFVLSCVLSLATYGCGGDEPITVTGGFEETIIDRSIQEIGGLATLDYDADGDQDVVVAASGNGAVFLYDNLDGVGGQWSRISISGQDALVASKVLVIDSENDGDPDILVIASTPRSPDTAGELTWYENVGGSFRPRIVTGPRLVGALDFEAGDITGDGLLDLVVTSTQPRFTALPSGGFTYFENLGGDFDGPFFIDSTLVEPQTTHLADIDADGDLDLLGGTGIDRQFLFYENLDGRRFKRRVLFPTPRTSDARWIDVESDGELEGLTIFTHTTSTSLSRISPLVLPTRRWTATSLYSWEGLGVAANPKFDVGDFNGDARADLVVANFLGSLDILTQTSTAGFRRHPVRIGYRGLTDVKAIDLNVDGRLDFLTTTTNFASRDRLAYWKNISFPDSE